eukprot:SAG31_NODE_11959_length_982_cov_0.928652_1_plen_87_part_10
MHSMPHVEYEDAPQGVQLVRSAFGLFPGAQVVHDVRLSFTTYGDAQATQATPNGAYVVPTHAVQPSLLTLAPVPAGQGVQAVRSAFT